MQDRSTRRHARAYLIPALAAVAGAAVLVYWTSTARPMWVDEEMLALNVRDRGFGELAGPLWLDQSAPFGWLVLERAVMLLFGTGERAVRALTVGFGVATLTTAWWVGRRWMTAFGSAVLVALCATGEWLLFFTLELKHYSADAAGALLIPALAAWALDADDPAVLRARALRWWIVAAIAMWFSNGALFVTPGCAAVLVVAALARAGGRSVIGFAPGAIVWLVSFALSYAIVLRHALANPYLKHYWAFAFPPVAEGVGATVAWLASALAPFAVKPAGSGMPAMFWTSYLVGVAVALARRSNLALTIVTVPLSGLALALGHFVPTFERLAIWMVPSLYVGVALCADAAVRLLRPERPAAGAAAPDGDARRTGRLVSWTAVSVGVVAAVVVTASAMDVVRRGVFAIEHRPRSNYGLDDRGSLRWLMDNRKSGDVVMSTHYGLAAIWWYGGIDIADAGGSGRLSDGTPLYEIHHVAEAGECARWHAELESIARGRSRLVVYLGFRMNVEPEGFGQLVIEEFGRRWPLVGYKEYAEESRLAIFDLRETAAGPPVIPSRPGQPVAAPVQVAPGCVSATPARRW